MKGFLLTAFLFGFCTISFSQQPIDVTQQTIKVGAMKTEEMYFGFAEGDQVIFNFEEADKKELKEIEIVEWPNTSKFSDFKTSKIENKTLNISHTSVYKFRFYNSAISGRVCRIKIQRIAANEATKNFNTAISWSTQYDTAYYTVQEKYLVKQEYQSKQIIPLTDSYINSGRNSLFQGGKSRIVFPIQLPANTVEWYYQFSAFRDKEQVEQTRKTFNLAVQLTKLIDVTGGLKFGIDMLTQPPGADYCDIYLLDQANSIQFEAKNEYRYYPIGTRENIKSGIVKMSGGANIPLFVGIKNPDAGIGINVVFECVAIVLNEEWGVRDVKKFTVTSKQVPLFHN